MTNCKGMEHVCIEHITDPTIRYFVPQISMTTYKIYQMMPQPLLIITYQIYMWYQQELFSSQVSSGEFCYVLISLVTLLHSHTLKYFQVQGTRETHDRQISFISFFCKKTDTYNLLGWSVHLQKITKNYIVNLSKSPKSSTRVNQLIPIL